MPCWLCFTSPFNRDRRAWKSVDWHAMSQLHVKGSIGYPASKAKSVWLTEEGIARSEQLFHEIFGTAQRASGCSIRNWRWTIFKTVKTELARLTFDEGFFISAFLGPRATTTRPYAEAQIRGPLVLRAHRRVASARRCVRDHPARRGEWQAGEELDARGLNLVSNAVAMLRMELASAWRPQAAPVRCAPSRAAGSGQAPRLRR